jgi:hypothetical protein
MPDAYVQVAPDSSGKKVRTIEVTTYINGVETTVEMQVLALADDRGNVINDFMDYAWKSEVLDELKRIRRGIGKLVGDPFLNEGD